MSVFKLKIAEPFLPLLTEKKRYKLLHGGRGGGKSYVIGDCLLTLGRQKKLFIACLREIQDSIKDSVYKLLCDRISFHGLEDEYKIFEDRIENQVTGTKFIFKGLRDQDPQKIKSLEGVDIAWIEEAQTITKKSWLILDPTIRKDGSEIWISMNRELENDPIWVAVGANPDERTIVIKVNYYDNPFCPEELKIQARKCKEADYDDYLHVWEGEPVVQGEFKLISSRDVRRAFETKMDSSTSPLVIGLDIARGGKDRTVFCFRKGRWCFKFHVIKGFDTVEVADTATMFIKEYRPHRLFLDLGNSGAGVYDILKHRGFGEVVKGIDFGGKAIMSERYKNKRAEMWNNVKEWLKQDVPVQLPADEELFDELCAVERVKTEFSVLQLEPKDKVRERLGRSPDKADALALTFAEPVYDRGTPKMYGNGYVSIEEMFREQTIRSDNGW